MDLSSVFSSLTNTFKSDDITDNLIETRNRIREGSMEVVNQCIKDTASVDFSKNRDYVSTLTTIRRHYKKANDKMTLFQCFAMVLDQADNHLNEAIGLVDKYFTKTVDKSSLTHPRVQLLSLGETIDFVADFIPKYCHFVIAKQNELAGGEKVEKVLSRGKIKWINENTMDFYKALSSLSLLNLNELEKILKSIPDVVVTESGDENKMFDKNKLDPTMMGSRFFSARFNPFYYWRMWRVDAAHEKYKMAKEEVESIKIELEAMNSQIQNGQVDAYTERQRELAIERMNKLEYQIAKHEEKARNTRY